MSQPEWEDVASPAPGDYLERIPVPGGWLYRTLIDLNFRPQNVMKNENNLPVAVALVFVRNPSISSR